MHQEQKEVKEAKLVQMHSGHEQEHRSVQVLVEGQPDARLVLEGGVVLFQDGLLPSGRVRAVTEK